MKYQHCTGLQLKSGNPEPVHTGNSSRITASTWRPPFGGCYSIDDVVTKSTPISETLKCKNMCFCWMKELISMNGSMVWIKPSWGGVLGYRNLGVNVVTFHTSREEIKPELYISLDFILIPEIILDLMTMNEI